jgi:uncharacterized protein
MFIDLTQLNKQDTLRVDYQYPEGGLDLQDASLAIKRPCQVSMRLERIRGHEVRARGTVKAEVQVLCDRCLTPMTIEIDSAFDLIYLPVGSLTPSEDVVLEQRELDFSFYSNDRISLDELAREQIQLALPMINICNEACKGLCSQCGQDLNTGTCQCSGEYVDPRWSALLDLKKKTN